MDGLHKLKTPGLCASLLFQVSSIYLLFQAINLRSDTPLTSVQQRVQREAPMPAESSERLQQLQCSEGIAGYQWGALGCVLISVGCLGPMFAAKRSDDERKDERVVAQPREPELLHSTEPDLLEPAGGVYRNLKKGLEELESCLKSQPVDGLLIKTIQENINVLENQHQSSYESLVRSHEEIQKAASRLHRLMDQCRESANYAAANRVDWKKNKLIDVLSQMRQNLDLVVDLSKNINSLHASTLRLLGESLQGETILNDKITRAQEQLDKIQNHAQGGNRVHDLIISIIGESRDNITGASKFVGSLNQKWDALVQLTDQIDEVAEKINSQSLAVSLEMVRGQGGSQGVTDLFPLGTELRSLAARFHTYARHIKDAILEVRDEVGKTTSYLSQAGAKADHAFVSVNQCGEYYRGSVAAVKHSASELLLLQQEVNIHMKKLHETRAMGQSSAELLGQLDRHLQGHNGFGLKIMEETSQITVHSEKTSTLLAKQYHELNHCQKMLASSAPMLSDSIRFTLESKQTISSLAACLTNAPSGDEGPSRGVMSRGELGLETKIEDFKQLIASMEAGSAAPSASMAARQRPLSVPNQRTSGTWRVMH